MSVPEIVHKHLGGETPNARVPLKGDDELLVTPTRTILYRAEGLLSGESIEEYTHEAERVSLNEGRRKSTIRLDHGIEGESEFSIPSSRVDDALMHVLAGVLTAAGITGADESIDRVYRLGELTIVITDARVVKHIGSAVWDEEYEEYEFEDVTGIDIERGDVSSQIIVEVAGRPQRIKTPSSDAREVRERIEQNLLAYHDVESYAEFKREVAPDAEEEEIDAAARRESVDAGDPVSEETIASIGDTSMFQSADSPAESGDPGEPGSLAEEVAELRTMVEQQTELLESHEATIRQLIEELRRLN